MHAWPNMVHGREIGVRGLVGCFAVGELKLAGPDERVCIRNHEVREEPLRGAFTPALSPCVAVAVLQYGHLHNSGGVKRCHVAFRCGGGSLVSST